MKRPLNENIERNEELKHSQTVGNALLLFGGIAIGLFSVLIGIVAFWLNVPMDPLVIKNKPVPVDQEKVSLNSKVTANIDYCKKTEASGRVIVSIVTPEQEFKIPESIDSTPPACKMVDFPVTIPDDPAIENQTGYIRWIVIYKLNPLREARVEWTSESFMIVK